ncbi:GPP34 family phosphoprotein [Streptomyces mutabilis]|uniref:GOLPH3/VPS74 family protein n=1 Tax=Streptomyces mutabilis TaxID=67332 RepID=UPI00177EF3FB|nr:GPP34 family phosphoprotein [Streptomyces mutabilis]GGQ21458.1 hypothetical protein GCM10010279_31600 [Streptomyces mutabilis]
MSDLAQDLALLLLDDDSGRTTVEVGRRHRAVGNAILLDLVRAGRITVEAPEGRPDKARPVVRDSATTGDPVLDEALAALAANDTSLGWAAETIGHRSWRTLMDSLVARGLVRHEEGRFLGLIRRDAWPSADPGYEAQLVTRIRDAVVGGRQPDESTLLLIMIVHAIGALPMVLPGEDRKAMGERAEQLVRENAENGPWRAALKGFESSLLTVLLAS